MKILSIPALAHDTSFCIIEDGKIISYRMEERFSRNKHDFRAKNILKILIENQHDHFDKIVISKHFLDEHIYPVEKIKSEIEKLSHTEIIIEKGNHHLYHAYSGFYNSGFDEALCFSLDSTGAILDNGDIEIETVYHLIKNKKEKVLYKRTREFMSKSHNHFKDYYKNIPDEELSVGERYCRASAECGYDIIDGAGKIMGLGQYKNYKQKLQFPYNSELWKKNVDKAYKLQDETQNHVLNLIKKYTEKTSIKNVVISGGYGLSCVANYFYIKNLKEINLYVDPICFDAGISIGKAYYHYTQTSSNLPKIKSISNVYIGYQEISYDLTNLDAQKVSYEDVVNLLLEQNIVALFQGKSEAGQRALGNRSLLFDPRNPKGKDIVNLIKKRESFRPFAGTILLEESSKWFNMLSLQESPYMQYAVDAHENAIKQVPAIIHADNTCRIQTVTEEQNQHFYNLIKCFFKETEVPMLLNTSFNLGGEALVETFEHAIYTLKNSRIEYLYLPEIETLITVKNEKFVYQ